MSYATSKAVGGPSRMFSATFNEKAALKKSWTPSTDFCLPGAVLKSFLCVCVCVHVRVVLQQFTSISSSTQGSERNLLTLTDDPTLKSFRCGFISWQLWNVMEDQCVSVTSVKVRPPPPPSSSVKHLWDFFMQKTEMFDFFFSVCTHDFLGWHVLVKQL